MIDETSIYIFQTDSENIEHTNNSGDSNKSQVFCQNITETPVTCSFHTCPFIPWLTKTGERSHDVEQRLSDFSQTKKFPLCKGFQTVLVIWQAVTKTWSYCKFEYLKGNNPLNFNYSKKHTKALALIHNAEKLHESTFCYMLLCVPKRTEIKGKPTLLR